MKSQFLILFGLATLASLCRAQDNQPAGFGPGLYLAQHIGGTISVLPAQTEIPGSYQPMPGGSSAIAEAITPQISALARNLQNDPTLIYNYVHDHIRYVHYFGSHKGATLTLLEGCGNDFDQCALLVALLTSAGYSPTYQFGTVQFPYSAANNQDYQHWIGATMPDTNWDADVQLAYNINTDYGFPWTAYGDPTNTVVFQHVWVQVIVGPTTYALDPSFKVNQFTSGISVDLVAGISTNKLLTDAAGTATTTYVQGLQEGALRGDLTTCTTNLLYYIQTNCPNASALQVFGGQTITPSAGQSLPTQTAFTIETYGQESPLATWQYIPTNLMAVLIVILPGTTNSTNAFYIPGLAGNRLSLVCTATGIAQLWQEDTEVASVQTTGGANAFFSPDLTIQHPFGTNWDFSEGTFYPARFAGDDQDIPETCLRTNATYNIAYGFDPGPAWLTARQRQLDYYRQHGYADTSRQVVSETLNVMALTYMEQEELARQYVGRQLTNISSFPHILGLMAQETGYGYHIDLYELVGAISSETTNDYSLVGQNQELEVFAYFMSGLEHTVIEQLQSSNLLAASTVKVLELASTNNLKIYLATSANWSSIQGSLSGYNNMSYLTSLISAGDTLLLPQSGSIPLAGTNSWTGQGFAVLQPMEYGLYGSPMLISGGYNGGFSEYEGDIPSPSDIASLDADQSTYVDNQSPTAGQQTQNNGDPVSMVDGSFQITSSDLSLGGTEPRGLNLTRYYTSARRNLNLAGMAPGWLHNYYSTASAQSAWQSALGGPTPQTMAPMVVAMRAALDVYNSAQFIPKNMVVTALIANWGMDQLIKNAVSVNLGNQTIQFLKQPNGSYTPQANCTMTLTQTNGAYYLQERQGRMFKFATNSLLTNIVDQYGQSMKLAYNSSNLLTNVTDWKNRTLTFTYTGTNLTSVSDGNRTVHYGYTGADLTSFTDADGNTFTYQYDTNHQVIATLDALTRLVVTNNYDINGHITTQWTQGATNKLWQVFVSGWQTTLIDPMSGQQDYYFDDQSRQIAYQDALGNLSQTFYDGHDHVIQTISPLNETNQFVYDSSNNLIETIDPLGFSNVFNFDSQNRMTNSIDGRRIPSYFGYNSQFSLIGVTNGNGDWTVFVFNSDGTLHTCQDSVGTTTYGYDNYGQRNTITYPGSLGSEGYLNSVMGDVLSHTNGLNYVTSFSYNNRRQLTNTIAPTNVTASATFDANGNLSTTTDARNAVTSNSWSVTRHLLSTTLPPTPQGNPVIANSYDTRDWLASMQNPLSKTTYYTNDAAHRLIATTDPLQRPTLFSYDSDSRRTNTTDAMSNQTAQFWNGRGNLVMVIDAATNIVGRAYDGNGNLLYLTNRNTNVWQFQYDGANRITNTISPLLHHANQIYNNRGLLQSSTDPLNQPTTFTYDAKARMTSKMDNMGTITNQYDLNNNLTVLSNAGTGTKLLWAYDAYNRAISFTNAAGSIIQYRYDANGNMTNLIYPGNLTVKYYYDSNNRLTNVTDWTSKQTTFTYDLAGHLTGITRPNNTLRSLSYDDDGELTNIVEQTTTKFPLCFYTLHYNPAGRSDWEFKGPLPHTNIPPTRTMTYDSDNRLLTFNGSPVNVDNDGNLTSGPLTNNTFGTYTYDARNELTSAGGISYGYDPEGNRTSFTNGTTNTTFVVDAKTSQTLMRIKNGVTNYYIYGKGLLYEIDVTATTTTTAYYHYDSRGSTVALTDLNGNPTDMVEYSPYGTTTYRYGTNDTPFRYNGRYGVQTDPNGLLYMRSRYYNPYISRFLNPDPSGFAGGLNFYAFANGNPITEEDPFGLGAQDNSGGNSWLGNLFRNIPIIGGLLGGAGDLLTGVGDLALGVGSLGFSGTLQSGLDQFGWGINNTVSGSANLIGSAWTLPNTTIGLLAGSVSLLAGEIMGTHPTFSIGNNAFQFGNLPWGSGGALTIGNTQLYNNSDPTTTGPRYDNGPGDVVFGSHEQGHTYQYELLGPLFLPVYFMNGGISPSNPLEVAADNYAQGIGSWWPW